MLLDHTARFLALESEHNVQMLDVEGSKLVRSSPGRRFLGNLLGGLADSWDEICEMAHNQSQHTFGGHGANLTAFSNELRSLPAVKGTEFRATDSAPPCPERWRHPLWSTSSRRSSLASMKRHEDRFDQATDPHGRRRAQRSRFLGEGDVGAGTRRLSVRSRRKLEALEPRRVAALEPRVWAYLR
jgi:hypothetical protein